MNQTIVLLVGASGSGKTSIANELCKKYGWTSVNSYTTRPPRFENEPGHLFVSEEEMDRIVSEDTVVGFDIYNGYRYCATAKQIDENDVYVVNPGGVITLKNLYKGSKKIKLINLVTPKDERIERMMKRGDSSDDILDRLDYDETDFASDKMGSVFSLFNEKDYIVLMNENGYLDSIILLIYYFVNQ